MSLIEGRGMIEEKTSTLDFLFLVRKIVDQEIFS